VCAPALALDAYFSSAPAYERPVYQAVASHLETLGPLHVEAVSVGILFKRVRTFAELRPKRDRLELSVLLSRVVVHPKIVRRTRTSGQRAAYFVALREAADVDEDVRDWLTEAYASSPDH
jgi:putative ubiquitin-RnfH superfamily antitoxin RatB of RatAB toxin-antitoxin module